MEEGRGQRSLNIAQIKSWPTLSGTETLSIPDYSVMSDNIPMQELASVHWTEIIYPGDPRSNMFDAAKKKELFDLIQRGAFIIILKEEVGPNPNLFSSRFALAVKHQDGKEKLKARFVLGGHRDRDKRRLIHNSATLKQQ
jgi:hypothetical protein